MDRLKIVSIENPTTDSATLRFAIPASKRDTYRYKPGQYLTLQFNINDEEVRRSYSLNSSPFVDDHLEVTVKRVAGGLVSNYINDEVKVGDEVVVLPPDGRFYASIEEDAYKTYFLFAAGSGITPIMSILKSVLTAAPNCVVNLFFGNKNQDSIIFQDELTNLQQTHPERLVVVHTLSDPKVWTTWKQWNGRKGRIDAKAVDWFVENHPPVAQSTEYFICGPGAMNTAVRDELVALGVPSSLIHIEQFANVGADNDNMIAAVSSVVDVFLEGRTISVSVEPGTTILEALKDAGERPPYSCQSGVCATCVAKVKKGSAEMKACMALDEDEIKAGQILTCQALPTSEKLEIVY